MVNVFSMLSCGAIYLFMISADSLNVQYFYSINQWCILISSLVQGTDQGVGHFKSRLNCRIQWTETFTP